MRKFLLLIFLSLSFRLFPQTNVYHPFPDTDAVWTVIDGMSHGGTYCDNISCDRSYIQKGDTIINGIQYNKLYLNEHCTETWIPAPPPAQPCSYDYGVITGVFVGGLRNDSANKKVFYYDQTNNQECLLYDFSVNVGDSIPNWWTYCVNGPSYWKVISIDSILVGTAYHKRFNINGQLIPDTSIIEGVGSLTGLLGSHAFFENFNQLVCFSVLNQTMYTNPNSSLLCGVVGINEAKDDFLFSIFPNPSSGIFSIRSLEMISEIKIENVLGEKIYSSQINSNKSEIDLAKQPQGIYFIKVNSEKGTAIKRLIKQ